MASPVVLLSAALNSGPDGEIPPAPNLFSYACNAVCFARAKSIHFSVSTQSATWPSRLFQQWLYF